MTTADLLAALEFYANPDNWNEDDWGVAGVIQPPDYGEPGKMARAAIAAHKEAHRDGADDQCPCYAEGWQAGHEAERRPPGAQ